MDFIFFLVILRDEERLNFLLITDYNQAVGKLEQRMHRVGECAPKFTYT